MGDLISRQEAKDAIDMALDHIDHVPPWVYDNLLNALNEVPSAEKAQLSEEDATSVCKCPCEYREPCDYCHYDAYREHGCPAEEGLREMSDMMTFPETWEEYEKLYGFNDVEEIYTNNSRLIPSFRVKQWLDHLPSAEPERKKGEWDDIGGVLRYGCLFCHHAQERKSNFCPNCGADLRGEQE